MTCALGIDPGFAALGWSVVSMAAGDAEVVESGVIRTQKSDRKGELRACDDNLARGQRLHGELERLVIAFRPVAVVCEAMSWPRHASVTAKMGIVWGVIASVANDHDLPVLQVTPQELKRAVCGRKGASKDEVRYAVEQRLGNGKGWPKQASLVEHAADAAGAVLACLDHNVLRMARQIGALERP